MRYLYADNRYLIALSRGARVRESLTAFCAAKGIAAGTLSALGALRAVRIAFYDLDRKEYLEEVLEGDHEVLSLIGNIALVEEAPFLHAHVVLGDRGMRARGGHLVEAEVAVTLEVALTPLSEKVSRAYDEEIGLNLLALPEEFRPEEEGNR